MIFCLDVPFEHRPIASAHGGRWSKEHKAYLYDGARLPAALLPYASRPHSWERWVEHDLNEAGPAARTAGSAEQLQPITPRGHQAEAARMISRASENGRSGFLLADDVGVGKTISAWLAVQQMEWAETVLIVCPVSVIPHWRRTIEAMGDGDRRVVVTNYERLDRLFDVPDTLGRATVSRKRGRKTVTKKTKVRKVRTKKGVARHGTALRFDVVIADESHKLRNVTTARSKLMRKLTAEASFTLWLSATAGQTPLELAYLAPLLTELTGRRVPDLDGFEAWCQEMGFGVRRAEFGKWVWEGTSDDIERMRKLLFDAAAGSVPGGLRRRPTDIAGWPELQRIATPVDLSPEQRSLYESAWSDFRQARSMSRGENSEHRLVAQLRFRQKASLLRLDQTAQFVLDLLENGRQVAVSVAFTETQAELRARLEAAGFQVATINGAMPSALREEQRKAFQRGDCQAVIYTVEEGISLHQGETGGNDVPRAAVIHDLRWSAIQMAQIEGRAHRDGRHAPTYWMFSEGTVEERIARIVAERVRTMKAMIGDDSDTIQQIEALLDAL
jgi:SNF2 family DNA or RNA helicase